jgi:hypothetical protein
VTRFREDHDGRDQTTSPFAIGVLKAPDNFMPVGMTFGVSRTDEGLETWRLVVHGAEVPGRFVIVDREFRSVGE